jgi:hypothetical protein
MGPRSRAAQLAIVVSLVIPAFLLVEAAQKSRTLVINGHPGEVAVIEREGHAYVEIETLARTMNGSLSFNGNQIILTLPGAGALAPTITQPSPSGFTKDFIRAGIEEMAVIREWRSTLRNAVEREYPVTEDWIEGFQARAEASLRLVSLAATTESDKSAVQLLTNEFNNMKNLSNRFLEANKSRTYVSHESLNNDPMDQRILNCARSLAAMAANGQFADDGSCH